MSVSSNLMQVTDTEKQTILSHYGITETEFEENVNRIWEWLLKTDLPKHDINHKRIRASLLNCKMSLEKTKRCIEGYYRTRTIYSDFYDKMLPNAGDYYEAKPLAQNIVMPRLTPDLCRITVVKYLDPKKEARTGLLYHLTCMMVTELRVKVGDFFLSNTVIIDLQDFDFRTFVKYTPAVVQTLVHTVVATNMRLKNLHYVNVPDIMHRVTALLKSVLPVKFANKICTHKSFETLYEYIPKEYLPADYNGDQPSIKNLYDQWCEEIENNEKYFQGLLQAKLADGGRERPKDYEISEGSFRKLTID